jgi:hypothetical protein
MMTMTQTMKTNIASIWNEYEQESKPKYGMLKTEVRVNDHLECFICYIPVTDSKVFQLTLKKETVVKPHQLRKFSGVEIQTLLTKSGVQYFTLILLNNELTDLFTLFIEDILDKLKPIGSSVYAMSVINQRVGYWKKLFSKATGELLSVEKQRGLFGELFFLILLLKNSSNHQEVLQAWRGAESANQDFAKNGNAVEIKTSKANNPSVHISNEQQLDFTIWDHLFLGLISVAETTGNRNSLAAIIEEIRDLVNHEPELIEEFDTKLESAGVSGDMMEYYNEVSYSVNNVRFFRVQDGFPVILRGNIQSDAIYNVKYQIDISSCGLFESLEEDVIKIMI